MIIVGVHGRARAGKDTIAHRLVRCHGFFQLAFADSLKQGCASMLGVDVQTMYEGDRDAIIPDLGFSIRHMLQFMGTEVCRSLSPDLWVNLLARKLAALRERDAAMRGGLGGVGYAGVVVSDVRFPNEVAFLREQGAHLIHVMRDGGPAYNHASEAPLDLGDGHVVIMNNGSLQDLYTQVDFFYDEWRQKS